MNVLFEESWRDIRREHHTKGRPEHGKNRGGKVNVEHNYWSTSCRQTFNARKDGDGPFPSTAEPRWAKTFHQPSEEPTVRAQQPGITGLPPTGPARALSPDRRQWSHARPTGRRALRCEKRLSGEDARGGIHKYGGGKPNCSMLALFAQSGRARIRYPFSAPESESVRRPSICGLRNR